MGIEKSEIKILTANSIGADLEDMLESAQKNELRHEGAKQALQEAGSKVGALTLHFMKDLEEGQIDFEALKEPLGLETLMKRWLGRAVGVLDNLHTGAMCAHAAAAGQVSAYTKAMGVPAKVKDEEIRKAKALLVAIEAAKATADGEDVILDSSRPVGRHPGNPLAARRAAEAQNKGSHGDPSATLSTTKKTSKRRISKKKVTSKKE